MELNMTFKMLKTGLFICMLGCFTAGLALAADTNSEIEKDKPEEIGQKIIDLYNLLKEKITQ